MHFNDAVSRVVPAVDANADDGEITRRLHCRRKADLMARKANCFTYARAPRHLGRARDEVEDERTPTPEASSNRPKRACEITGYGQIIDGLVPACDQINVTWQRQRADVLTQQQSRTSDQSSTGNRKHGSGSIYPDQTDRHVAELREEASGAATNIREASKRQTVAPNALTKHFLQRRKCRIADEKILDLSESGIGSSYCATAGERGTCRHIPTASFAFATSAYHPAPWLSPLAKLPRFDRFATLRVAMKVHHNRRMDASKADVVGVAHIVTVADAVA